ncbi:MAG: hypothetical protein ABR532_03110 [Candidatus Dormibacteria bacterium]
MMKVGRRCILSPVALVLLALAACARGNPPKGVGTSAGTGAPTSTAEGGAHGSGGRFGQPGQPTPDGHCPTETVLDPGAGARNAAVAAAQAAVPQRYPPHIDITGFRVTDAYPADASSGYGAIAYGLCGAAVGQRTWVVELSFPKMAPSVDLSAGQLFVSRCPDGWKVWFQYH